MDEVFFAIVGIVVFGGGVLAALWWWRIARQIAPYRDELADQPPKTEDPNVVIIQSPKLPKT